MGLIREGRLVPDPFADASPSLEPAASPGADDDSDE